MRASSLLVVLPVLSLCQSWAWAGHPATVLDHRVEVRIDTSQRLTESVTWVVRIDDPAACAAGLLTPPGLAGASDSGAMVLEDVLVIPGDTPASTTFTLTSTQRLPRGGHSGEMVSAPDLPVQGASLSVVAPARTPLTVWADPKAVPEHTVGRSRQVTMSWSDLAAGGTLEATWSTFTDWNDAADDLEQVVADKLADKNSLGRDLAADIEGVGVAGVLERTWQHVSWDEGHWGTWRDARGASEVATARSGSAAERGVVLLSMLQVAGLTAHPGYLRPATEVGEFPITVPSPALLQRPVVVVDRPDGMVIIDPAAERTAVPDRPASTLGATLWTPGSLPIRLVEPGLADGSVHVHTSLSISGDGSATWSAVVQANGAAREHLRNLLAPLDERGRTEAMARLVRQARPDTRIAVDMSGTESPARPLKITISGSDPSALSTVAYGLRGRIAPTVAPALGAWLPSNLVITESLAISGPPQLTILGSSVEGSDYTPAALVRRTFSRQGPRGVLDTEVQRPYRRSSPATDARASEFLGEQAGLGVELLLFATTDRKIIKAVRGAESLEPAERAVLEAQIGWAEGLDRRARKALVRAVDIVGFEPLVAGLERFAQPDDLRPWRALSDLATERANPGWRMAVVDGLDRSGHVRPAWLTAATLRDSTDPDVRLRALMIMERLQGPRPDPERDPDAAEAWDQPLGLLMDARAAAEELGQPDDPRVTLRLAERALEERDLARAEAQLEAIAEQESSVRVQAMLALAAALGGTPIDAALDRVDTVVESDAGDAAALSTAASALERVGAGSEAAELAVAAARLQADDPELWGRASDLALSSGQLVTAMHAARQASDLDPASVARSQHWALLATLARDRDSHESAATRAQLPPAGTDWPPTFSARQASAPPEALLALMQHDDSAVEADPNLLAMRSQLRIDHGLLDRAARDGMLLSTRHKDPRGAALTFAATAGRLVSTQATASLDKAVADEVTARTARMEYRLVTGAPDPLSDARALADDPRAKALVHTRDDPADAASGVPGWPADLPDPGRLRVPGFATNRTLSAPPGVQAVSNPAAATAVVVVGAATGLLPAPLGLMYTAQPQPIEQLDDGGQVLRLRGGVVPLFAAVTVHEGRDVYGIGFTAASAARALQEALDSF